MMDAGPVAEQALPDRFAKLSIAMSCFDHAVLDSYTSFIIRAGTACNLDISGRVPLPTKFKRYTVLKSPHIFKKARSQYESRLHRRLVQLYNISGGTAAVFLDYVLRMIPPGLDVKLTHETIETPPMELLTALGMENPPAGDTVPAGVGGASAAVVAAELGKGCELTDVIASLEVSFLPKQVSVRKKSMYNIGCVSIIMTDAASF